jgi:8-oxo-dGTP pyrophosphatase MutT (NUDIX family)
MIYDTSYGIIPLQKFESGWKVLLIQQHQNYWTFPKGHPEFNETPIQAAKRELKEETGLDVCEVIHVKTVKEHYIFTNKHLNPHKKVHKTVIYFLATVDGELKLQQEEILEAKWVMLHDAVKHITFPEAKAICREVIDILSLNTQQ